ncbi:hypothetical protein [Taklimakanibacter deserti]|uniref:hypothetical protein n=1 Tax=Taklimakanibacter deserti TaxID=2267839 RepID=UPI000E64D9EB
MAAKPKQRPEALARFAETARADRRTDKPGLVADQATSPIPTSSEAKDEAATKVLQEGATGADHDAEAAVDKLPDRILESRQSAPPQEENEESDYSMSEDAAYDATSDPRTGRPPSLIEAEALNKERELRQLRNAQLTEGEDDMESDEIDIDVTLEEDGEMADSGVINAQDPGRMRSPDGDDAGSVEDDSDKA